MKIVFDAYWWIKGPASLRHVLREIVFAWHREAPDDLIVVVVRAKHAADAREEIGTWAEVVESGMWPQAMFAAFSTARVARRAKADVVLTHNFAPLFGGVVKAVYLHDVMFLTNPEWFSLPERAYFRLMPILAPRANVVFTSSSAEADRIRRNVRGRTPVHPVGLGLSSELINSEQYSEVDRLSPGGFILTVGRLNVRKNLLHVVEACAEHQLITAGSPLVIVGAKDGKGSDTSAVLDRCVHEGSVIFTGFVEESQLRWLYRNTRLFLYMSLDEGFGMPPVEAAAFGASVLVSDIPVMRENLEGHAQFVDPHDKEQLAAAIRGSTREESAVRRAAGQERIRSRHDWSHTVRAMRSACDDMVTTRLT